MCGFVAAFSFKNKPINTSKVKAMSDIIAHRGPDDHGFYQSDWFCMAFNRLSIIDTSVAGHQPMIIKDEKTKKDWVCVFNGEIYNYKELRSILESKGYKFSTNSDTEVLIKSYLMWGERCVEKLSGMFSFIIVDVKDSKVFVARDHLGIKPLYYSEIDGILYFVSEVKSLSLISNMKLNKNKILEQIAYRYVPGEQTIFNKVKRVLAGSHIKINKVGNIKKYNYFNLLTSISDEKDKITGNQDVCNKIEKLTNKSIVEHTESDVGFNVQLSGGVDSSYIVSILNSNNTQKLSTYSVETSGEDNEEKFQKIVADKYSLRHQAYHFTNYDFADAYIKATWHFDFPLIHSSCPLLMLLTAKSAKTSKVVLTGEGADELFLGYSRHQIPSMKKRIVFYINFVLSYFKCLYGLFNKIPLLKKIISFDPGMNSQNGPSMDQALEVLNCQDGDLSYRKAISASQSTYRKKIMATDQTIYLQGLLERQDKMSMSNSVEARVPFSNPKIYKYINRLPINLKVKKNIPKYILKTLLNKYFDYSFVFRKKVGFKLPLGEWLRDEKGMGRFIPFLQDNLFKEREIFKFSAVQDLIDSHMAGDKDNHKILISLINFEVWHRIYIDKTIKV